MHNGRCRITHLCSGKKGVDRTIPHVKLISHPRRVTVTERDGMQGAK